MKPNLTAAELVEQRITLSGCETPEPSIRQMVEHYYLSHGVHDWQSVSRDFLSTLRAQEAGREGWQPIASAPDEGTVLGYLPAERSSRKVAVVQMRKGKPWLVNSLFAFDCKPVEYWQPLPSTTAIERGDDRQQESGDAG